MKKFKPVSTNDELCDRMLIATSNCITTQEEIVIEKSTIERLLSDAARANDIKSFHVKSVHDVIAYELFRQELYSYLGIALVTSGNCPLGYCKFVIKDKKQFLITKLKYGI